jgi:hypothetical protein
LEGSTLKLACIYNVWDASYLLRGSIMQIRKHVDVVIVVRQDVSNYGEVSQESQVVCDQLLFEGLIDQVILFVPENHLKRKGFHNECKKRNLGLERAKELQCTHYILMDCDEYYHEHQFANAKNIVEKSGYEFTRISLYTYFKEPTWKLVPLENYYVPFICRLKQTTLIGNDHSGAYVDPARAPKQIMKISDLPISWIVMHHYSWIRKDIGQKLRNSSARDNFASIDDIVAEFQGYDGEGCPPFYSGHIVENVVNYFNIDIK